MLTELHIENFAIIDRLDLALGPGLVIFTGETGAGKSILIDAVETLLGGRADATMVRSETERASVEGVFKLDSAMRSNIHPILAREELLDNPDYLSLAREIRLNGRNVARVNGRVTSVSLMREIGELLVDIHGQSEHLSLLRVQYHQKLLDRFAELEEISTAYHATYLRLQTVRRELDALRQSERDAARLMDMLNYQIQEIELAHIKDGEEDLLREERNRLANAEELNSITQEALIALDEGSPESAAATDLLGQVISALNQLTRLDPSLTELNELGQSLFDNLADLSRSLRSYADSIEFNPRRLDQVEERLALIYNLKRKYGDTIPDILKFGERARVQLDDITHASERIDSLEQEERNLLTRLAYEGQLLSQKRRQQSIALKGSIELELADLQMTNARFQVDLQQRDDPDGVLLDGGRRVSFDAHGLEKVEFLIAPNPGEGMKPLVKIASGGETSRLMLALKHVFTTADQVPSLIFDEIDQGIGGRVGTIVGQKLWKLARQHQVLCITHLPQLAAFGEQHFHVEKEILDGRTITQVTRLQGDMRLDELAQMFGGITQGTIQSARELLQVVEKRTAEEQP
jgi:DNA repair protein RecN (Recombination protein N)